MKTIEPGGRTALEVYEELKRRLEGMGYLPDAFFRMEPEWGDGREFPRGAEVSCTAYYGPGDGVFVDVNLRWAEEEDGEPAVSRFIIGGSTGDSGTDLDRMSLAASAITKAFYGGQTDYARRMGMGIPPEPKGAVVHLDPEEQRVLMDALAEQQTRQAGHLSKTEQLLRRMAGSVTTYLNGMGIHPLRMSGADRAVLAIRDGAWETFAALLPSITDPEQQAVLLPEAAGSPSGMGAAMTRLLLDSGMRFSDETWLDACKRAVDTGEGQRVRLLLDRAEAAGPHPTLFGDVLCYAYGQNRAMARDLVRWARPEQVSAAPSKLLCAAAYARDLTMLTEMLQKGLQPGDQAAPLLLPLLTAYDEQRVAHLLRDGLRVQPEDYEAMNVCLQAQAQSAAGALLEQGMELGGYLEWAAVQNPQLDNRAREILETLRSGWIQTNGIQQQNDGGAPTEAQHCGFGGERSSGEMSEPCPQGEARGMERGTTMRGMSL